MKKDRHIKSTRKETWTDLRVELNSLRKSLGFSEDRFSEVDIHSWSDIKNKIWSTFSNDLNSNWIWGNLKVPNHSVNLDPQFAGIDKIVNLSEKVWLVVNETVREKTKFWIFEGYIEEIQNIISQSYRIDEIIIASKTYQWIFIVNHHHTLIGTGQIIDKLKTLEK